jgi:hypothetical protein
MDLTGIGIYTLQEAERLTGADAREVSRWLFGYTVLSEYGVRTDIVVERYRAEKSKKMAASLYGIPVSAVDAAIRYERLVAWGIFRQQSLDASRACCT